MIRTIIFSRNRPAQLEALLDSLHTNIAAYDALCKTDVILRSDFQDATNGYHILADLYPSIDFTLEGNFKETVNRLIDDTAYKGILLLCDDEIFYRPINLFDTMLELNRDFYLKDRLWFNYALRLGLNTRFCYTQQQFQNVPTTCRTGFMDWHWRDAQFDFAYPWSVTGTLWSRPMLRCALAAVQRDWHSPNTLEGALMTSTVSAPRMLAPKLSVCFSVPLNRVQTDNGNHAGLLHPLCVEEAAKNFCLGGRLRFKINPAEIVGAHQEVPWEWVTD